MEVHRIESTRIGFGPGEQTGTVICLNLLVYEGLFLIVENITTNIVAVIDLVLGQRIVRDQAKGQQYGHEKSHRTITPSTAVPILKLYSISNVDFRVVR
jgi:hypothetical protein